MDNPENRNSERCDLIGFLALVNCKLILPFEELFRGELTNLQFLTLCALRGSGEVSVTALADRLYLSKQQMTKIISKLCDDGYVVRGKHPSDGRVVLVKLTEKTAELFNQRHRLFSESASRVIEQYDSKQDVGRFNDLINELSRILSALPGHAIERVEETE